MICAECGLGDEEPPDHPLKDVGVSVEETAAGIVAMGKALLGDMAKDPIPRCEGMVTPPTQAPRRCPNTPQSGSKFCEEHGEESEMVEHPDHYGEDTVYEVIKVLQAWGLEADALLWNVVKYVARAGKKEGQLVDLKKARFYLDRRISQLEESDE